VTKISQKMIPISDSANNGQHESLHSLRARGWPWEDIFLFEGEWYDDDRQRLILQTGGDYRARFIGGDFRARLAAALPGLSTGLYALFSNGIDPLWDGLDPERRRRVRPGWLAAERMNPQPLKLP
jgi:hypothetical protein